MRVLGAILILLGGGYLRCCMVEKRRQVITWGEELCSLLDVLECGTILMRRPLPAILREAAREKQAVKPFLLTVLFDLPKVRSFSKAWETGCREIPTVYRPLLLPLGTLLTQGDRQDVLKQTREEVHRKTVEEREKLAMYQRLMTALCFSGSFFTVLVLW